MDTWNEAPSDPYILRLPPKGVRRLPIGLRQGEHPAFRKLQLVGDVRSHAPRPFPHQAQVASLHHLGFLRQVVMHKDSANAAMGVQSPPHGQSIANPIGRLGQTPGHDYPRWWGQDGGQQR